MITNHALQRTQERTGFNPETSKRFITNAIQRGKSAESLNSREREYLSQPIADRRAMVYNSYCFIVSKDDVCITVFGAPKWFGKKAQFHGKERIRDAKKYLRYSDKYKMEEDEYGYGKVS